MTGRFSDKLVQMEIVKNVEEVSAFIIGWCRVELPVDKWEIEVTCDDNDGRFVTVLYRKLFER